MARKRRQDALESHKDSLGIVCFYSNLTSRNAENVKINQFLYNVL